VNVKGNVPRVICPWSDSTDVLQRGGGKLLDVPSSFTLRYPSSLVEEFLQQYHPTLEKQKQQLCNHYFVLNYNAYGSAILFEYTNSRLTHRK
jgi:hypothetical protein